MMRPILLAAVLAMMLPAARSAELDADALIRSLARPAPASVAFKEVRYSSLLREPLIVSGELGYSGPTDLQRKVLAPYHETTTITGESVRVERDGEAPRTFALKRAPELRGLLAGFSALLAGDVATLRRNFTVLLDGGEHSWNLQLTPVDANARQRVNRILVNGGTNTPKCFSTLNRDGGASVMLLGPAASTDLPKSATLDRLLTLCRTE
jgi:hypothetical protein